MLLTAMFLGRLFMSSDHRTALDGKERRDKGSFCAGRRTALGVESHRHGWQVRIIEEDTSVGRPLYIGSRDKERFKPPILIAFFRNG
jgi:hypothetical protein